MTTAMIVTATMLVMRSRVGDDDDDDADDDVFSERSDLVMAVAYAHDPSRKAGSMDWPLRQRCQEPGRPW